MAFKKFGLDEHTEITVYKRRRSRSLKLSVTADGSIRVSIPLWAPYEAGVSFARSRQAWIASQQRPTNYLKDGMAVGKAHHLRFAPGPYARPSSRLVAEAVIIKHPLGTPSHDPAVQAVAATALERALRVQAERLLPQRLASLAAQHGFQYRSVTIKKLKSRWGSCDQHRNIVLNLYLMQLPWECIDYVLLHELTHTRVLRHGAPFWAELEKVLPRAKALRRTMRTWQPVLQAGEKLM